MSSSDCVIRLERQQQRHQRRPRCCHSLGFIATAVLIASATTLQGSTIAAFSSMLGSREQYFSTTRKNNHHHHFNSMISRQHLLVPSPVSTAFQQHRHRQISSSVVLYQAKPKSGTIVDSYRTVSVNCSKCRTQLFRYKKKNGTKSNLVKCYIERIADDSVGLLKAYNQNSESSTLEDYQGWNCPTCNTNFARGRTIHGRPALKLVGGKIRMTK